MKLEIERDTVQLVMWKHISLSHGDIKDLIDSLNGLFTKAPKQKQDESGVSLWRVSEAENSLIYDVRSMQVIFRSERAKAIARKPFSDTDGQVISEETNFERGATARIFAQVGMGVGPTGDNGFLGGLGISLQDDSSASWYAAFNFGAIGSAVITTYPNPKDDFFTDTKTISGLWIYDLSIGHELFSHFKVGFVIGTAARSTSVDGFGTDSFRSTSYLNLGGELRWMNDAYPMLFGIVATLTQAGFVGSVAVGF